jgi:hypothetical protein
MRGLCDCPDCETDHPFDYVDKHSLILGMELAMRIIRNRAADQKDLAHWDDEQECQNLVGMIRIVQVEIGSGRMPVPSNWTPDEIDEVERIR